MRDPKYIDFRLKQSYYCKLKLKSHGLIFPVKAIETSLKLGRGGIWRIWRKLQTIVVVTDNTDSVMQDSSWDCCYSLLHTIAPSPPVLCTARSQHRPSVLLWPPPGGLQPSQPSPVSQCSSRCWWWSGCSWSLLAASLFRCSQVYYLSPVWQGPSLC